MQRLIKNRSNFIIYKKTKNMKKIYLTFSFLSVFFLSFSQDLRKGVVLMVEHSQPYLFRKRGIFYFSRRVPKDLWAHYDRSKIVFSLRTKSTNAAKIKAASLASQLEEDWLTLRWRSKDTPLRRFCFAGEVFSLQEPRCGQSEYHAPKRRSDIK